jgi:hypothetical protein
MPNFRYWKMPSLARLRLYVLKFRSHALSDRLMLHDEPAPKDFIDKVALLRVRRHKTLAQSSPAAAEECGTNKRHLREISRRWMPRWPGDRDGAALIHFANKFRTEFALSVAPLAANR